MLLAAWSQRGAATATSLVPSAEEAMEVQLFVGAPPGVQVAPASREV
jgi:hypothetical protein